MTAPEANRIAASDTAIIQQVIARARFRLRLQGAMEGATTALILAAVLALVSIFAIRTELVSTLTGLVMLCFVMPTIIAGALIGAFKRLDDETIARRIDRASNLSDRLSTAIAFRRTLATAPAGATSDDETMDLMVAAIRDGVKATPRANIKAATPFSMPKDLKAAFGFLVVSALAAGLAIPPLDRAPRLFGAEPDFGPPGTEVHLRGMNLLAGVTAPVASAATARSVIGTPAPAEAMAPTSGFIPKDAYVYLGPEGKGRPIDVLDWTRDTIRVRIPADIAFGETHLTVYIGREVLGPVPFTVIDPKNSEHFKEGSVLLDADERAYVESILAQLKELAKKEKIDDLDKFIAKIEQLLKDAEEGKITKEQLLAELAKAEEMLNQGMEPNQAEIAKKMAEMGKELKQSELTKELGQALEKNDLDKAKQELEELARKLEKSTLEKKLEELEKKLADPKLSEQEKKDLQKKIDELKKEMNKDLEELRKQLQENDKDNKLTEQEKKELEKKLEEMKQEKPLTDKQKEELQKQMENVSKQMQKQDDKQKQEQQEQMQKLQEQVRRLEKEKQEAKTEQERLNAERQLQKKKDELQKLQKENDQKDQSAQRQALKRLQRDMEKAAEQLQKPDKQESQDEKEERERQASQKIKDAARETGKVDQDQRKQGQKKKMSSQMDDLREAMRRAKQKGNKGPNDPFGKNAKNQEFGKRARGGKGNGQTWKPGGQQPGGQQPGGQGNQPGGQQAGVGHDDNLTGDSTDKSGKTKDEDLVGQTGSKGTSRRETILAAAQKGFASTSYKKVYQDYQRIVEEVMRTEKLPSSYKYYVKRYFAKIHPSGSPESVQENPVPAPAPGNTP